MLALFGKKKVSPEQVAHTFVKHLLETVEQSFPDVAAIINDHSAFITPPNVSPEDHGRFLMILIAANFDVMVKTLPDGKEKEVIKASVVRLAEVFDMPVEQFAKLIQRYKSFLAKVNRPSKNPMYSMSKGIFHKYKLNGHQEAFFKDMNAPNPQFLKTMDRIVSNFVWNWEEFQDKYRFA